MEQLFIDAYNLFQSKEWVDNEANAKRMCNMIATIQNQPEFQDEYHLNKVRVRVDPKVFGTITSICKMPQYTSLFKEQYLSTAKVNSLGAVVL